jgi:hypothetical protein
MREHMAELGKRSGRSRRGQAVGSHAA